MRQVIEDLVNADYLVAPHPEAQLVPNTDASQYAVGAVLGQVIDGRLEVIEYGSNERKRVAGGQILCDQVVPLRTAKTHPDPFRPPQSHFPGEG
ncbi:hypothetical protein GNI_196150 [Gregarina niphandrodes]|uniref:Reverse transcriptase/retrotransposon-derived protein RNase H-like domain-containing protein n=1 Tax=Gregarina niphandrodes TaxID=110365 RepID=A0A023AWC7_GRENI|nr:hypothetical protein GNI_196150 [Gregarina niphandrodes]EZG43019.1 hypothetical protein GNI_196150 [Gregarina niphandrodes]|eukprot:XP_011133707.1 hypothetical protein GNI_196150 [Gregarina niphandrodes]